MSLAKLYDFKYKFLNGIIPLEVYRYIRGEKAKDIYFHVENLTIEIDRIERSNPTPEFFLTHVIVLKRFRALYVLELKRRTELKIMHPQSKAHANLYYDKCTAIIEKQSRQYK